MSFRSYALSPMLDGRPWPVTMIGAGWAAADAVETPAKAMIQKLGRTHTLPDCDCCFRCAAGDQRSEEHTSELQSLMRISYAVFCLKKKKNNKIIKRQTITKYK